MKLLSHFFNSPFWKISTSFVVALLTTQSVFAQVVSIADLEKKAQEAAKPLSDEQDWACKIILCLADPRGATTEKACVPPIKKMWRHLIPDRKGRVKPIPRCLSISGSGRFVEFNGDELNHWDLCPTGYQPLNQPQWVAVESANPPNQTGNGRYAGNQKPRYSGVYENIAFQNNDPYGQRDQDSGYGFSPVGNRACVSTPIRTTLVCLERDIYNECVKSGTVHVYKNIVWQKPHPTNRSVDYYVDNKLTIKLFEK